MLKWEKTAKFIITILILLNFMIVGISMLPTKTATAASLPSDMPTLFVDPQNISVNPGNTFTISVKVFNLSNNFYGAAEDWIPGEPLPPPGSRFNFSLGNLYGLDIQLSWDPDILQYESHVVAIPEDDHPGGVLHPPLIELTDIVDQNAGTYWLSKSSQAPAPVFNCPNANATVFNMTFTVKDYGTCTINITNGDLVAYPYTDRGEILHWIKPAQFKTPIEVSRIKTLDVGAWVNNVFYDPPVISGEDALVKIGVINDNQTADTCNITLYKGTTVLYTWTNITLGAKENKAFNYTIAAADLDVGKNNFNVTITSVILKDMGLIETSKSKELTVINTPQLVIDGPSQATAGDDVTFDASKSIHTDPNGAIWNYTWTLTAPNSTKPQVKVEKGNVTVVFSLDSRWLPGNWTVALEVTDNYGLTYDEDRPLTASYRITKTLEIAEHTGPGLFNIENIVLIIILVVVIALAGIYLRRRSR